MASKLAAVGGPQQLAQESIWQKTASFLMRRRVTLTGILFVVLLLEDIWERVDPLNLTNFTDYKVLLGLALVFAGLGLRSWAAGTLHKRAELTTSGPYGLMRHPLYIGSLLMMLGFCTLIHDPENIYFVLGPVLALYLYRAIHEEKILREAFPDQYEVYERNVARFFPRRLPKKIFSTWSVKQWMKNREYQAVSAALLGLAAIKFWQMVY